MWGAKNFCGAVFSVLGGTENHSQGERNEGEKPKPWEKTLKTLPAAEGGQKLLFTSVFARVFPQKSKYFEGF